MRLPPATAGRACRKCLATGATVFGCSSPDTAERLSASGQMRSSRDKSSPRAPETDSRTRQFHRRVDLAQPGGVVLALAGRETELRRLDCTVATPTLYGLFGGRRHSRAEAAACLLAATPVGYLGSYRIPPSAGGIWIGDKPTHDTVTAFLNRCHVWCIGSCCANLRGWASMHRQ